MAKTMTRSVELEPIDRLEEKVKRLVTMIERMQADERRELSNHPMIALGLVHL